MSRIQWASNAKDLGTTLLFILLWVCAWGILEHLINQVSKDETKRLKVYICLLLVTSLIVLLVGQDLKVVG